MKQSIFLGFILMISLLFAFRGPNPDDEAAIKKICIAETQAWLDNNLDAWLVTHLKTEQDVLVWTNADGSYTQLVGWKNIETAITEGAKNSKPQKTTLANDNFLYTIKGEMAFVAFDQTLTEEDGKVSKSREHRVLVKSDGNWKIHSVLAFYNHAEDKK